LKDSAPPNIFFIFRSAGATPTVDTVTPFFRKAKLKGSHKRVTAADTAP
jgi:hypothetical protein